MMLRARRGAWHDDRAGLMAASFKAKLAGAAMESEGTRTPLVQDLGVHPNQITKQFVAAVIADPTLKEMPHNDGGSRTPPLSGGAAIAR